MMEAAEDDEDVEESGDAVAHSKPRCTLPMPETSGGSRASRVGSGFHFGPPGAAVNGFSPKTSQQMSLLKLPGDRSWTQSAASELVTEINQALPMASSRSRLYFELQARWKEEGLQQRSHFLGLLSCIAGMYFCGRWPQHVWLCYLAACCVVFPMWYVYVAIQRSERLWLSKSCNVMAVVSVVYFAASVVNLLGARARLWAFRWFFMTALGYQSWSAMLERPALVFHSLLKTVSILVHIAPALVCLPLRWPDELGIELEQAWPQRFGAEVDALATLRSSGAADDDARAGELLLAGAGPYFAWWLLFSMWVLLQGVDMPARGHQTPLGHALASGVGLAPLLARLGLHELRAEVAAYMFLHALFALASLGWALLCWHRFWLHLAWSLVLSGSCVWNGAIFFRDMLSEFALIFGDMDAINSGDTGAARGAVMVELASRKKSRDSPAAEANSESTDSRAATSTMATP